MNILIVKLSAIGDVVHTLPSVAALRKRFPNADITWVVEEAASDLVMDHPHLDRIIISHRKSWIGDFQRGRIGKALKEIRSFVRALRARPYDMVIDFHGLFKSAVIVLLSGGNRKLGYDSLQELSGLFYNEKIHEDTGKHAVLRYLDFARHLGAHPNTPEFIIPIQEENETRVTMLLGANRIGRKDPFVAVSPQALWETKLWSDQKFAQLCERIIRELNVPVVLTGGGKKSTEGMQSFMTMPAVDLAGRTTLRDLACLYREASVLVTTDSGPMHLAAAVGTPVVALFGPTDPVRTGPYGLGHTVINKEMPCSPCFLKTCETKQCMRGIAVDDVFQAIKKKMMQNAQEIKKQGEKAERTGRLDREGER
ncbi:MAG: glycosyltransferase family 9 protein [Pseudomonadota bacterium]